MKKLICILASAALLGACEQRTEVTPTTGGTSPAPAIENNTTIVNPSPAGGGSSSSSSTTNTTTTTASPSADDSDASTPATAPSPQ